MIRDSDPPPRGKGSFRDVWIRAIITVYQLATCLPYGLVTWASHQKRPKWPPAIGGAHRFTAVGLIAYCCLLDFRVD